MGKQDRAMSPTAAANAAIVAAGQAVRMDDSAEVARYKARNAKNWWQERAWLYDDELGELGFAHDFVRQAMARIRIIVGIIPEDDPEGMPTPLTEENLPEGLDIDLCRGILDLLQPFTTFMGDVSHKLDIPGECHVGIYDDPNFVRQPGVIGGDAPTICRVFSNDELVAQDGGQGQSKWAIKKHENDSKPEPLPADAFLFRVWNPHGRWSDLPISPMRRLLGVCDELMLLTQMIRGIARSRVAMNGGILAIPEELEIVTTTEDDTEPAGDGGDGETDASSFIDDFIRAALTAMADHESAAAALPLIVRGRAEWLEKIKMIEIGRTLEETLLKIRAELLERIANGLNLPREIVLGVGGTNHWNADQIDEQTWHVHLEPRAMNVCAATTEAFYRPQLRAHEVPENYVRRLVVWYDPTWFIGPADQDEAADAGLDNYAISLETWRRVRGFTEADAPDDEEIARRIAWKAAENAAKTPPAFGGGGAPPEEGTQDTPAPEQPVDQAPEDEALAAAGAVPGMGRLGRRLVGIERDTRARLQQAVDSAAARALERAGVKVNNAVSNARDRSLKDSLKAQIASTPAAEIPRVLGAATVSALGLTDEQLTNGALGSLEQTYRSLVRRAQTAAAYAASSTVDAELDPEWLDDRTADDRDAGWALLAAGFLATVGSLLYSPGAPTPQRGEVTGANVVSSALVRGALDRAGGANVALSADGLTVIEALPTQARRPSSGAAVTEPVGGGAVAGPTMLSAFEEQLGLSVTGYRWVYGDAPRAREFEPHLALDGVAFADWDADVLANSEDFPFGDHYHPGDHDGCLCDFEVELTELVDRSGEDPTEGILLGHEGDAGARIAVGAGE